MYAYRTETEINNYARHLQYIGSFDTFSHLALNSF